MNNLIAAKPKAVKGGIPVDLNVIAGAA
jgi:hypothetical protein